MFDLDDWLKRHLREEETVLWMGRPDPARRNALWKDLLAPVLYPAVCFSGVMMIPTLFVPMESAFIQPRLLVILMIVAVMFVGMSLHAFTVRRNLRHVHYALTSRRAIVLFGNDGPITMSSTLLDSDTPPALIEREKAGAEVSFGRQPAKFPFWLRYVKSTQSGFDGDYVSFRELGKEDAERVVEAARNVMEQGRVKPPAMFP